MNSMKKMKKIMTKMMVIMKKDKMMKNMKRRMDNKKDNNKIMMKTRTKMKKRKKNIKINKIKKIILCFNSKFLNKVKLMVEEKILSSMLILKLIKLLKKIHL